MKKISTLILLALTCQFVLCCNKEQNTEQESDKSIVILYDNDVHCSIDDGGYEKAAGLKDAIASSDTACCALVSSGDFSQGSSIAVFSMGLDLIKIMNAANYDIATIGNHEFDNGAEHGSEMMKQFSGSTVCSNFTEYPSGVKVFKNFVIKGMGRRNVAFIGVTTPETLSTKPSCIYDEQGNQKYDILLETAVTEVQKDVDAARAAGADYVIILSHLGCGGSFLSSTELIAGTEGIDAVLDGHSHTVIECEKHKNRRGQDVLLTQTGKNFEYLGKLVIGIDGKITSELLAVKDISQVNARTAQVVDSVKTAFNQILSKVVGTSDVNLTIDTRDGIRYGRMQETNAGDFVTDAYMYTGSSDIGLIGASSIKADIAKGDFTVNDVMSLTPYQNTTLTVSITGKDLVELLCQASEKAAKGEENGNFLQVAGMKYTIHKTGSPVVKAEEVLIFDKVSGNYAPVEESRSYSAAICDYLLTPYPILAACPVIETDLTTYAYECTIKYLSKKLSRHIGTEYEKVQGRIIICE